MKLKNKIILSVLGVLCLFPIVDVNARSVLDDIKDKHKKEETIKCGYTSSAINGNSSLGNVTATIYVKNGIISYEFSNGYVLWEDNEKLSPSQFTNKSCPALEMICGTCDYIDEYCNQDSDKICKLQEKVYKYPEPEEDDGTVGFKNGIDKKYVICNGAEIPYGIPVIASRIVNLIKVAIPVILIVLGMIDFLKAVISNDEKNMKASTSTFVRRGIAAFVIFFVFTIVQFVFSLVDDGVFGCVNCVLNGECGPVYKLGSEDTEKDETIYDYLTDSGTFNFDALPDEYTKNTISIDENIGAEYSYICNSSSGNVSKISKCNSNSSGGYDCELYTKPFTMCGDLCKKLPGQVTCKNY